MSESWVDLLTGLLQLAGAFLFLASAIGTWRLPDLATRVHAPTKAASLGIALFGAALLIHRPEPLWILEILLLLLFVFISVPLAVQVLLRCARREHEDD